MATLKLVSHLKSVIRMTGPLSISSYMRHCLTHPLGGYYMKNDPLGSKGDFVTSPEISQVFGELIAAYIIHQHQTTTTLDQPSSQPFRLVELGPGRGTLLCDVLRVLCQYDGIYKNLSEICLVDKSPHLRKLQSESLEKLVQNTPKVMSANENGISLSFHDTIVDLKPSIPSVIIAHEFFDALPILKFEYTKRGWREILVDHTDTDGFRYVLAPQETSASISVSNTPRYDQYRVLGKRIEVCPEAFDTVKHIASLLQKAPHGGGGSHALFIDYGHDKTSENTLRGIKDHKFVDILDDPGNCDITADVDFSLLKDAVKYGGDGALSFGPITQRDFLLKMGIRTRVDMLAKRGGSLVRESADRLISKEQMGNIYKFLAITDGKTDSTPYPFETSNKT